MATIYTEYESENGIRLQNMTGAAVIENQFVVMGGKCLKATEAIAPLAVGGFEKLAGKTVQADALVAGEDAWATGELPVYWNPSTKEFSNKATIGYYLVGYTKETKTGARVVFNCTDPVIVASDVPTLQAIVEDITELSGRAFLKTVTLTSALATTPVEIVADADVPAGKKVYITDVLVRVNGADAWVGAGTVVVIRDTNNAPVTGVSLAKAQLTGNTTLFKYSAGVTLESPILLGTGFTAKKGIVIVADGTFETSGSDLVVTVVGYVK